jgi:hypothetical protein
MFAGGFANGGGEIDKDCDILLFLTLRISAQHRAVLPVAGSSAMLCEDSERCLFGNATGSTSFLVVTHFES